ncbi:hypothetical protein RchiOBHm_Chr1g0313361 [Rosa chinensis]|uniref:Uncharacterized protein n=1 Tax=Rosa chinensis TaxID=74649 RepID=A0A2P6S6X7_ROSCH|nr:hypothetical protein RchiOBHm_Chr1g0313361 [Rosa chinensis]
MRKSLVRKAGGSYPLNSPKVLPINRMIRSDLKVGALVQHHPIGRRLQSHHRYLDDTIIVCYCNWGFVETPWTSLLNPSLISQIYEGAGPVLRFLMPWAKFFLVPRACLEIFLIFFMTILGLIWL